MPTSGAALHRRLPVNNLLDSLIAGSRECGGVSEIPRFSRPTAPARTARAYSRLVRTTPHNTHMAGGSSTQSQTTDHDTRLDEGQHTINMIGIVGPADYCKLGRISITGGWRRKRSGIINRLKFNRVQILPSSKNILKSQNSHRQPAENSGGSRPARSIWLAFQHRFSPRTNRCDKITKFLTTARGLLAISEEALARKPSKDPCKHAHQDCRQPSGRSVVGGNICSPAWNDSRAPSFDIA